MWLQIRLDVPGTSRDVIVTCAARLQQNGFMPLQSPSPNLRPLQVLQDADRPPLLARRSTNALNVARMLFVRAVGEIEPGDIHAQP